MAAERVNVPCLHLHSINHGPFAEKLSAKEALKTDRHSLIALLAFHQNTSCESLWPDMNGYRTSCFFRCTFGSISLVTLVLLKFDFSSDIVMSTWFTCQHRQKPRQELPSRIEEAKRSGVRPLLNVKGPTWKTLDRQQLPFSVLEGCVFVILPSTNTSVCSICCEQHRLISFGMR